MRQKRICCPPLNAAIRYAGTYLAELGLPIASEPDSDTAHLILPVPSYPVSETFLEAALTELPKDALISGGNLDGRLDGYRIVDFLKDPYYLAENAAITASCAVEMVEMQLISQLADCHALIVGWGRIGKCLGQLLMRKGTTVTIAARKDTDRALIHALGCRSISLEDASLELRRYDVVLNTVPVMVLPDMDTKAETVILELASKPGMSGPDIIDARGLPNKMAPDKSGELIARTFIRLSLRKEE